MIAYLPTRRRLDLATGEADIALRMRNLPDSDDLVARSLGRMAFAVYARSADISTVIVPPEDPNLSQQAALIARYAEGRTIAARIGDMPIRYQAARSGLGAAVLPCWLGDSGSAFVRVLDSPPENDRGRLARDAPPQPRPAAGPARWRMRSRLCSGRSRTRWQEFCNLPHAEDDALRPLRDAAFGLRCALAGLHRRTACASTFFITPGSASSCRSRRMVQRIRPAPACPRGTFARKTVNSSGKCVKTWRTVPGRRCQRASMGASSMAREGS